MKLIEIFADRILEIELLEMATKRKYAIAEIRVLKPKITEHFINSLIFNSPSQSHWYVELNGWLKALRNLEVKQNSGTLDSKVFFEILFNEYYGHGDNVLIAQIKDCQREHPNLINRKIDISPKELLDKLKILYTELAKDLSMKNLHIDGARHYVELVK